jgi:hypothetical protein
MINYPKVGRFYKHYKGGTYRVLFLSKHTETGDILVNCQSLEYGSYHSRPLDIFFDNVNDTPDGDSRVVYRFVLIDEK